MNKGVRSKRKIDPQSDPQHAFTAAPWKMVEIAPDDPEWGAFELWHEGATEQMIANGAGTASMRVFGMANAAFIVKAVNAHDDLVVALDELLLALSLPGEHCELAQATTRGREALAKLSEGLPTPEARDAVSRP